MLICVILRSWSHFMHTFSPSYIDSIFLLTAHEHGNKNVGSYRTVKSFSNFLLHMVESKKLHCLCQTIFHFIQNFMSGLSLDKNL